MADAKEVGMRNAAEENVPPPGDSIYYKHWRSGKLFLAHHKSAAPNLRAFMQCPKLLQRYVKA